MNCPALHRIAAALLLVALGACGAPDELEATPITIDADAFGLNVVTTRPGPIPLPSEPPSGELEEIALYFTVDGRLVPTTRVVNGPVALTDVAGELADEPGRVEGAPRLRTLLAAGDVISVQLRGGVAQVDLAQRLLDIAPTDQRVAIAQLVLSLTTRPGVGQVSFTSDRRPIGVIRADGTLTTNAVSRDDFASLVR